MVTKIFIWLLLAVAAVALYAIPLQGQIPVDSNNVVLWTINTGGQCQIVKFFPSGDKIVNNADLKIQIRSVIDGNQISPDLIPFNQTLTSVDISPDGNFIATAGSLAPDTASIIIYDANTYQEFKRLKGAGRPDQIAYSPDGQRVFCIIHGGWPQDPPNSKLIVLDVNTGEILKTINNYYENMKFLAISPSGNHVAIAQLTEPGIVNIFDINTYELVGSFNTQLEKYQSIEDLKISKDNRFVIVGSAFDIFIWDISQMKMINKLTSTGDDFARFACSNNNNLVILFPNGYINIYQIENMLKKNTYNFPIITRTPDVDKNNEYIVGSTGHQMKLLKAIWESTKMEDDKKINVILSYPNPSMDILNLDFKLESKNLTKIYLTDLTGKTLKVFENKLLLEGQHNLIIDLSKLANGTYFLRIESGNYFYQEKIIVLQ